MSKYSDRIRSSSEGYQSKVKSLHEGYRASVIGENDHSSRKVKMNTASSGARLKPEKTIDKAILKRTNSENEIYRICQALLLSCSVLFLCYHGVRHGRTEYSLLENGQIVRGYAHKAIVILSLGYSMPYSFVSLIAASMLVYSIVSKRPRWSLPSIILYLADLVCDVSDAIVAVWLFFTKYPLSIASLYAIGTILLIMGEIWIWLGVLRLYEYRTFK